jgi:hypothetical protein
MQENSSPQDAERLQRAVLALAFDLHPKRLPRKQVKEEVGDSPEVSRAVQSLVCARLLRWEDEALALTVPARVFDRLAL